MEGSIEARAIIFDMDGLLVDSEPLWAAVEADFARARGGDFTAEHARRCVGRGLESTLTMMATTFGFAIDRERDAREIIDRFLERAGELTLKPGARELIDAAGTRVPLALGSSSASRLVRAVLDAVGVSTCFAVVVSGDDVERLKPAPDIFTKCARDLAVQPAVCVVLEDSIAGVRAGRAAGMRVIAVPEEAPHDPAFAREADAVANDLFEARRRLRLP